MRPPAGERGFILMAALWLLLLGATLASFMLLRATEARKAVSADERMLTARLAAEAALETVVADLLLNGQRSRWAILPARGAVDVEGQAVEVELTGEAGRLDLNTADLQFIDAALQQRGVARAARMALVEALRARRDEGRPLRSPAQARQLLAVLAPAAECPEDLFTIYSGLSRPVGGSGTAPGGSLADVRVGSDAGGEASMRALPGTAIRVRLRSDGLASGAVIRLRGGVTGAAYDVLAVGEPRFC